MMNSIEERIKRFVKQLEYEIDKEDENLALTPESAIRKSSYQHAYWKCKNALQNILAGREFNENEPEQIRKDEKDEDIAV